MNGPPSSHPPLHFFTYLFRKQFGYRFDELAFEMDDVPKRVYDNFIRDERMFTDEGEWEGTLSPLEDEQVLSYVARGWLVYSHW